MTKSQAYYRSIEADRNAWRDEMPQRCMNCGRKIGWPGPQVHEILSRAQAPNAWGFRANYLMLDQACHVRVAAMSHAAQLAIKRRCDPRHYDLQEWLRRRNPNAMDYVTEAEVAGEHA